LYLVSFPVDALRIFSSVIWFRQFWKKKLVRDLPSRLVSGHVGEVLLFHWPFKGILSDSIFSDIWFRPLRLICQFLA
jgi:hypothetical protein